MSDWVHRLGPPILDASVAALLLLSLATMAMVGCRQPARRALIARTAIVGSLALIPLAFIPPFPRIDVPHLLRQSPFRLHPAFASPPALAPPSGIGGPPPPNVAAPHWLFKINRGHARYLLTPYLVGNVSSLGSLFLGYWGMGWLARRSSPASPETEALYRNLPYSGRIARPSIRVAYRVRRPVLIGLCRQTILIPEELDQPGRAGELRMCLLHELVHAERCDPWFNLASGLSQAFWFFLPPLWWIRAQLRLDQEFLADRQAASDYGPPTSYSSSLLNLAAPGGVPAAAASPSPPPRPSSTDSPLFQRILMLVRCPFAMESKPPRGWTAVVLVGMTLTTLGASSLSFQQRVANPSAVRRQPAPSIPTTFRVAKLTTSPRPEETPGRSALIELPVRLPDQFDLTVDVWGDAASMARTRVIGQRLPLPQAPPSLIDPALAAWHHIRIRRDATGLTFWIDGRLVSIDSTTVTTWLSVEPPVGLPAHFKNLVLRWTDRPPASS